MTDKFYENATLGQIQDQLTEAMVEYLAPRLGVSGNSAQLDFVASMLAGYALEGAQIEYTTEMEGEVEKHKFILTVQNGEPIIKETLVDAVDSFLTNVLPGHFQFARSFLDDAFDFLFAADYKSDFRLLDGNGHVVGGLYSTDELDVATYKTEIEKLVGRAHDEWGVPSGSTIKVFDPDDDGQALKSYSVVNAQSFVEQIDNRGIPETFFSLLNKDVYIGETDGENAYHYLLLDSLDSRQITFEYQIDSTPFTKTVSWNEIDLSGSTAPHLVFLGGTTGNTGSNLIYGTSDGETISGLGGGDVLFGFGGDDEFKVSGVAIPTLDGSIYHGGYTADGIEEDGSDTIDYSDLQFSGSGNEGVSVDLQSGHAQRVGSSDGQDRLISIENITGSKYDDALKGNDGDNIIKGGLGKDTIQGFGGDDLFEGANSSWNSVLKEDSYDGGDGTDSIDFYTLGFGVKIDLGAGTVRHWNGVDTNGNDLTDGDIDHLISVENVFGTEHNDKFVDIQNVRNVFNGRGGEDTISYQSNNSSKNVSINGEINGDDDALLNFEHITGTNFNDTFSFYGSLSGLKMTVDGAQGLDVADFSSASQLYYDGGKIAESDVKLVSFEGLIGTNTFDTFKNVAAGTEIYTGSGADTVYVSDNILVADLSYEDRLVFLGQELTGSGKWHFSENPYSDWKDGVRYGRNGQGDLLIQQMVHGVDGEYKTMFVSNYQSILNGATGNTAGINLYEFDQDVHLFFREKAKSEDYDLNGNFKILHNMMKSALGDEYEGYPIDPLIVDLDGDGIEAVADTTINPHFDMNGDGFAERAGWVRGGDAFLVQDNNANGTIDDISEMFGSPTQDGFAELATLDTNADGKLDGLDAAWSTLKLWRDADFDGVTDAGELLTLESQSIVSIAVNPTVTTPDEHTGFTITATGTFTRADNSTGATGNVVYQNNTYESHWLTDVTITAEAAALPQVKGHGTLPDLRAAMSADAALLAAVNAALPNMATHDIGVLRAAALPIFNAWRSAVDVPAGEPGTQARIDLPVLAKSTIQNGAEVVDYAIRRTDAQGEYWTRASGDAVHDAVTGQTVLRPTLAQVMAENDGADTQWLTLSADEISFMERWLSVHLPLGMDTPDNAAAVEAMTGLISMAWNELNTVAVRIAAQSSLALGSFFDGVAYDPTTDQFVPTTVRQLAPMIEAIFTAAPTDTAGAYDYLASWKPTLDVVINNFDRGDAGKPTFGYLFQNIVTAFENVGFAGGIVKAAEAFEIPTDRLFLGAGDVQGSTSADLFYLDGVNQHIFGKKGADNYIVGRNFGQDIIEDVDATLGVDDVDVVRFAHALSTEVTAVREGNDLILTVNGTTDSLRIVDQFAARAPSLFSGYIDYARGLSQIIFADGVIWDRVDMAYAASHPLATNDTMLGTGQTDVLDGGAGNDTLNGGDSSDVYIFGTGYGQDVIHETPQYVLLGGVDVVSFNAGITFDDVTFSRNGNSNDLLIAIIGTSDTLTVQEQFNASYTGIAGTEWFHRIEGFSFADGEMVGWDEVFSIVLAQASTAGDDTIYGFSVNDVLNGGTGNDFLSGGNENDTYVFGLGYGQDTIEDNLTDVLSGKTDTLKFLDGVDPNAVTLLRSANLNDLLITLNDGSSVTLVNQFKIFNTFIAGEQAFDRIERFEFSDAAGTVWTDYDVMARLIEQGTTSGNDTVYGFKHVDEFLASTGNDSLNGGAEGDTYHFGRGMGNDTIFDEADASPFGADIDKIVMAADILPSDIRILSGTGVHDFVLQIVDTGETLMIIKQNHRYVLGTPFFEIEEVRFANGTVWTAQQMRDMYMQNAATSGDDLIHGFWYGETIDGGAGNDRLEGAGGGDTYLFGIGSGNDVVYDYITNAAWSGADTIQFAAPIASQDVLFTKIGQDLKIELNGYTDTLLVEKFFLDSYLTGIENFSFSNGTTLSYGDVYTLAAGSENLVGTNGNDTLSGSPGNDTIIGLAGNDTLNGSEGDDHVDGGEGNDTLKGGAGNDVYVAAPGMDVIDEHSGFDEIVFGPGVTLADLDIYRVKDFPYEHLVIDWMGNQIKVHGHFESGSPVEQIRFEDGSLYSLIGQNFVTKGTAGDDNFSGIDSADPDGFLPDDAMLGYAGNDDLSGLGGADTLDGGDGDDTLNGGTGNDIYLASNGHDIITENTGTDSIRFGEGVTLADLSFHKVSETPYLHLVITWGTGNQITIHDFFGNSTTTDKFIVESLLFADGSVYDLTTEALIQYGTAAADTLLGVGSNTPEINSNDIMYGEDGNDTLTGSDGDDLLYGGAGNDTINAGNGNDTAYGEADSDTIRGDDGNDVIDGGDGDDAQLDGGDGNDIVYGGAGNDILNGETGFGDTGNDLLYGEDGNDTIHGNAGNDTITGDAGNDVVFGDDGNDRIEGGDGDDDLHGGNQDDIITGGLGVDTINGDAGNDTLSGGDGNDTINGGTGLDTINGEAGNDTIDAGTGNDTVFAGTGDDQVLGDDGDDVIHGEDGNDVIDAGDGADTVYGGNGADSLAGGNDADLLFGGAGSDTYVYKSNWEIDTVSDSGGDLDIISFTDTSLPENVTFSILNTVDLRLSFSSFARVDILGQFTAGGDNQVERLQFTDGFWLDLTTVPTWTVGTSSAQTLNGSANADTILGRGGNDTINGLGGNDNLSGDGANDTINGGDDDDYVHGGGGTDTIHGDLGNDHLFGSVGNDTLFGDAGNDSYYFAAGHGTDIVDDASGASDQIVLKGMTYAQLTLTHVGNDLVINTDTGTTNKITVKDFYILGNDKQIESLSFDDGSSFNLISLINAAPDAKNDAISGDEDTVISGNVLSDNGFGADSDPDGNTITVQATSFSTAHGAVVLNTNGTFTYTPTANYHGTDSFVYTLSDSYGFTDTATVTLSVNAVNDVPLATDDSASGNEDSPITGNVLTNDSDIDGDVLQAQAGTITTAHGVVVLNADGSYTYTPNADYNGADGFDYTVLDGQGGSDTGHVSLTLNAVNDAPVITSNGGGATASVSIAEDSSAVTTVSATDVEGTSLSYAIVGGADAAFFAINAASGVLSLINAPNFEAPLDANADNVYDVQVQVSDGTVTDTQALAVAITNVNETPVITSNGGGATATINAAENGTAVTTVTASDVDAGTNPSYAISGGADASLFLIDPVTGALIFLSAPNYETPTDAGANGVYDVQVEVSDGTLIDTQDIAVTVTNVNEAPVITSNGGDASDTISLEENTSAVTVVTATDIDMGATLLYSISGGADASRFTINDMTGELDFITAPDRETPTDVGSDNVYDVQVQVSDGTLTDLQDLAISVTNINEAPTIVSNGGGLTASVGIAENATLVTTVIGADVDVGSTLTYSIFGGADAAKFVINASSGALSFVSAPNYETPLDSDTDNVYDVQVQVSDGTLTDVQDIAVSVSNANEAPVITSDGGGASASISILSGTSAVTTAAASDVDAGSTLAWTISGGADASYFSIHATTGALSFITSPDYANPLDAGANNVYDVQIQVSDGNLSDVQDVAVTIVSSNLLPVAQDDVISALYGSAVTGNVLADNGNGIDSDPDNDTISVVETSVVSASGFAVTLSANGAFTYTPGADFLGTDTFVYTISDGHGGTDTATVSVTISAPSGAIVGNSGSNTINGTTGNDYILGLGGNDVLNALAGNDSAYGGTLNDSVYGGDGNDLLYGHDGADTLDGGNDDDALIGGYGSDNLIGGAGTDITIWNVNSTGFVVYRDNAAYLTVKDTGNLSLTTGYGIDKVYNDVETIQFNDVTLDLTTMTFDLNGIGWGTAVIYGTTSSDTISGYNANDVVYANAGNDVVNGNYGNDDLYGEAGADTLNGGEGNDNLYGGIGTDTLNGGNGTDAAVWTVSSAGMIVYRDNSGYLTVKDTNDITVNGQGADKVYNDVESIVFSDITLDLGGMSFLLNGAGWGTAAPKYGDSFSNTLTGTAATDYLYGDAGSDTLYGQHGDDHLFGGTGNDSINGGGGTDEAVFQVNSTGFVVYRDNTGYITVKDVYDQTATGQGTDKIYNDVEKIVFNDVTIDLTTVTFTLNGDGWGSLTLFGTSSGESVNGYASQDTIYAGAGNDNVYGKQGNDILFGEDGNDLLNAAEGNDVLHGGAGTDSLYGGTGSDVFAFESATAFGGSDGINDFSLSQNDKIDIANLLIGYDPLQDSISDFVQITTSGANSLLKVDADGGANSFIQIASITAVTGLSVITMEQNGNLITV